MTMNKRGLPVPTDKSCRCPKPCRYHGSYRDDKETEMSKHKKSPLDRFFLAVNWSEMCVDKRGIIHNARSHWCPLQVATRSSAGYYFLMARDRFKLTCREVQDIIRAADNSRAPTPQSREIRFKMLSLINGATR